MGKSRYLSLSNSWACTVACWVLSFTLNSLAQNPSTYSIMKTPDGGFSEVGILVNGQPVDETRRNPYLKGTMVDIFFRADAGFHWESLHWISLEEFSIESGVIYDSYKPLGTASASFLRFGDKIVIVTRDGELIQLSGSEAPVTLAEPSSLGWESTIVELPNGARYFYLIFTNTKTNEAFSIAHSYQSHKKIIESGRVSPFDLMKKLVKRFSEPAPILQKIMPFSPTLSSELVENQDLFPEVLYALSRRHFMDLVRNLESRVKDPRNLTLGEELLFREILDIMKMKVADREKRNAIHALLADDFNSHSRPFCRGPLAD